MARIVFTDTIGAAVLNNAKPAPANRFSNWKPTPMPVGDDAFRQSDGAKTKFRYRDDFGATFDLIGIPVASSPLNLLEPNGDIAGTIGGTPTNMLSGGPTAVVALARASGAPGDYGYNGLMAAHTYDGVSGGGNYFNMASAVVGHVYQGQVAVFVSAGSIATASSFLNFEAGTSGSTTANVDVTKVGQWQILTATATATATTIQFVFAIRGPNGSLLYTDLWSIVDLTAGTTVRPVDLADRLVYHLENGGTCQVDTGDADGNSYVTCGVFPGATIQPPVLTDKKLLEYSLSLSLVNLAGSPARMRCHYL